MPDPLRNPDPSAWLPPPPPKPKELDDAEDEPDCDPALTGEANRSGAMGEPTVVGAANTSDPPFEENTPSFAGEDCAGKGVADSSPAPSASSGTADSLSQSAIPSRQM